MKDVRLELLERTRSIVGYLRLLRTAELTGHSLLTMSGSRVFSMSTLHVLKAGVFLHLYNLVESTISQGLSHISTNIEESNLAFDGLNPIWQRVWGKHLGVELENSEKRMNAIMHLCDEVSKGAPARFEISLPSGNLDDRRVEDLFKRLGIKMRLRPSVLTRVKRQVLNDQGFLGLIRVHRNELAHGAYSFSDIGSRYTVQDLVVWTWSTNQYLRDIVGSIESFVSQREFEKTRSQPATPPPPPARAPAHGS